MSDRPPVKVEPTDEKFAEALAHELALADEAGAIREEAGLMDRGLFERLYPILTKPIPPGLILEVSQGTGKPYASKGVRSVQVLVDRCNNVLGPLWWGYSTTYHDDGKLCEVVVAVHDAEGECIVSRSSWGGVDRGNTAGNRYKGAFTNAAKLAFARLGVGSEVYIGATDHDPDTDPDAARRQAQPARSDANDAATDAEAELRLLLALDDGLLAKRRYADEGMRNLGAAPAQRLRELKSAPEARTLDELIARIDAAADVPPEEPPIA